MSTTSSESTTTTETRVRRLRRALAREGMSLHRRGEGFMVSITETRAGIGGASPWAYSLSLDEAEDYVTWFDQGEQLQPAA